MEELFKYLDGLREDGIYATITTSRVQEGVIGIKLYYWFYDANTDEEDRCALSKVFNLEEIQYLMDFIRNMKEELLEARNEANN